MDSEASAVGAISLLGASAFLKSRGRDVSAEDRVLDGYFAWASRQASGGVPARVYYDTSGRRQRADGPTPSATGMTLVAMWKRAESLDAAGRAGDADRWLRAGWAGARARGEFLLGREDRAHGLERAGAGPNLWLTDAVAARDGLLCLSDWSDRVGRPDPRCRNAADRLTAGILAMKERGDWACFYRVREKSRHYAAGYGDSLDQICFLPCEADVLPAGDPYARRISDWWTVGGNQLSMTPQTTDPADWRFYGLHWHHWFAARPENEFLYPGPGLQLAEVEWKHARASGDAELRARAVRRLRWAVRPENAGLWRAGDGGGLVDWRDGANRAHAAENWTRFIDTSGYLIQVILMVQFERDTRYVPQPKG